MAKFALFGVILLALQTSGQYQPQYDYPQHPCQPCKPLPPCPTHCQPLPISQHPNPAPYPTPYPGNHAPYPAPFAHPYGSIMPIPVPVFYNSKDWSSPLRTDARGYYEDERDEQREPPQSYPQPRRPPPHKPPHSLPNQRPNKAPRKPNRDISNMIPSDIINHNPSDHSNKNQEPINEPTDNNYEDPETQSPSRSGRRQSSMASSIPEASGTGRTRGLFSNIGTAAGSFADSIFK